MAGAALETQGLPERGLGVPMSWGRDTRVPRHVPNPGAWVANPTRGSAVEQPGGEGHRQSRGSRTTLALPPPLAENTSAPGDLPTDTAGRSNRFAPPPAIAAYFAGLSRFGLAKPRRRSSRWNTAPADNSWLPPTARPGPWNRAMSRVPGHPTRDLLGARAPPASPRDRAASSPFASPSACRGT